MPQPMSLTTKIQYKNFEPGEFVDKKERTYEETIALIEGFPWNEQRDHHTVGLTNASVTIQGDSNNYLKLTLYYNDKFILYYLDPKHDLYSKAFGDFKDSYPYIRSFFESPLLFDVTDFKHEHLWIQGKIIHFQSQQFLYQLNKPWWWFKMSLSVLCGTLYLVPFIMLYVTEHQNRIVPFFLLVMLVPFLMIWTAIFAAFRNFSVAKNNTLSMTRGNNIFYYGPADNPAKYDKKDIREVTVFGGRSRRSRMMGFSKIDFIDNSTLSLYIPDFIIRDIDLLNKLPGIPNKYPSKFPAFIPSFASTPS